MKVDDTQDLARAGGPGSGSWDGPGQPRFAAGSKDNVAGFQLHHEGKVIPIVRDVAHVHPIEVHTAMGSHSESELQDALDQMSYHDYFDEKGKYIGPDESGIGLRFHAKSLATGGSGDKAKEQSRYALKLHTEAEAMMGGMSMSKPCKGRTSSSPPLPPTKD